MRYIPKMKILITGVSSGIGNALAKKFLQEGHSVFGVARREEILKSLEQTYPNFFFKSGDVGDRKFILELGKKLNNLNFVPDVIVLGAGVQLDDALPKYNSELSKKMFNTNVFGVLNFIDLFLEKFLDQKKGHFIVLSSISAFKPHRESVTYPATKSAISMSFKGFNLHYKKRGVIFSNIYLGPIDTQMWKGKKSFLVTSPEKIAERIKKVIYSKKENYYLPFFSTTVSRMSKLIPSRLYSYLSEKLLK